VPNLDSLIRWQEYKPDIGENRAAKRPFTVELAVGLTKADLLKLGEVSDAPLLPARADDAPEVTPEEFEAAVDARVVTLATALTPFVRLGPEPLNVGGEPVDSLLKLLKLYTRLAAGPTALLELVSALRWFNTAGGTVQLFYGRLSGGSVGTTSTSRAAR
jgi:hypothetical protein